MKMSRICDLDFKDFPKKIELVYGIDGDVSDGKP